MEALNSKWRPEVQMEITIYKCGTERIKIRNRYQVDTVAYGWLTDVLCSSNTSSKSESKSEQIKHLAIIPVFNPWGEWKMLVRQIQFDSFH